MKMRLSLALTLLLAGTAGAQTTGLTVWGGAGTEAYIAPGLTLGLSAPVGQIAGLNAELRGSASVYLLPLPDVTGPLSTINADLLFSGNSGNVNLYGGPSVGYAVGGLWLVGATGGLRGQFGGGNVGWFSEARFRAMFDTANFIPFPLAGGAFGVTYRF
ncbi:hypothetical protein [Deinococcus multiflagellatus]|uniref:hypothetical protein n=1 Tax=Deinococcus multiflagellatus TaxID=1656887 RepID=UPI001CCBE4B0|nr:hypothetical protein [Deinococcus multiflagellatus]MBZ9714579.1 hypothetical protein [Deinococcus multiflagellatus]